MRLSWNSEAGGFFLSTETPVIIYDPAPPSVGPGPSCGAHALGEEGGDEPPTPPGADPETPLSACNFLEEPEADCFLVLWHAALLRERERTFLVVPSGTFAEIRS